MCFFPAAMGFPWESALSLAYKRPAYRAECALFRLGTNRLLKISGRGLRERENESSKKERKSEREEEEEMGRKTTRCSEFFSECSFTFARVIVFDSLLCLEGTRTSKPSSERESRRFPSEKYLLWFFERGTRTRYRLRETSAVYKLRSNTMHKSSKEKESRLEKRRGAGFDPPEGQESVLPFFKLRSRKDSSRYIAERRSA